MQLPIKINEPMHYSNIPMIVSGIVSGTVLIITVAYLIRKNIKKPEENKENFTVNVGAVRDKYVKQLNELALKVSRQAVTNRKAYQTLSIIIRSFVYEVTNIDMRKYVLSDFSKDGAKEKLIYPLIAEYYEPEFAERSIGDITGAIERTKKAIELWR